MKLINKILKDNFYDSIRDTLSNNEKEILDSSVKELCKQACDFYEIVKERVSTEDGMSEIVGSLEYLLSEDGTKEWQEKN